MSTKSTSEKTRLFAALRDVNPKTRIIFEKAAAKHKVDGVALLGLWIAAVVEEVMRVPRDISI